jgi:hypothetical protein
MPTELTMSGGAPWGFRLSGGGTQPLSVSRLTPGGKAALDGIVQGDHVIAINSQQVAGLQLGDLMELIKNTGITLHLTIISEAEVQANELADMECGELKAGLTEEHEECLDACHGQAAVICAVPTPEPVVAVCEAGPEITEDITEVAVCGGQAPGPEDGEDRSVMSKKEWFGLPNYIRKGIRPPKEEPEWKPQVHWMHGKLRLGKPGPGENAVNAAGGQLRNAVLSQTGPIELNAGPINGKITHSQYNTPLNMYSDPQIVSTLVSQAVASGADIQDASFFTHSGIKIDTDSDVYKRINKEEPNYHSKQSRSFNILNTLLKHPYEPSSGISAM